MRDTGTPVRWRRALFGAVVLISLVVLFAPAPEVPAGPDGVDKIVHVGLFAALAASGRYAGVTARRLLPALVVYGALSELLQSVPVIARSTSLADWLADVAGLTAGYLGAVAAMRARSTARSMSRSG
jgi:VanZ family protein